MKKIIILLIFTVILSGCSSGSQRYFRITHHSKKPIDTEKYDFATVYKNSDVNRLKALIINNDNQIYLLTRNDVLNLLGNPLVIKDNNNVVIWQYKSTCILNIVWKKESIANNQESLTIDVGNKDANDLPSTDTLNNNSSADLSAEADNRADSSSNQEPALNYPNSDGYKIIWFEAIKDNKEINDIKGCLLELAG